MKRSSYIYIAIVGAIAFVVGAYFYNKSFHENVRSKKKMYCYETYRGVVNPALYVKSESLQDSLVKYYRQMEAGNTNPVFNFPPLTLPYDTVVYILNYNSDSTIAEVVCYDDWAAKYSSYVQCWVSAKTLHSSAPPDSLIKRK